MGLTKSSKYTKLSSAEPIDINQVSTDTRASPLVKYPRQAPLYLHNADWFETRRGMEALTDTFHAADLLGVEDYTDIDVDTVADHVDLDAARRGR